MATQNTTTALIGLGAAAGLAAWYFLRKKKDDTEEEDKDKLPANPLGGGAYDALQTSRLGGQDYGYAVSCLPTRRGENIERGVQNYQFGDLVTCNAPEVFGVQSYRNTKCMPTRDSVYTANDGTPIRLFGQNRRRSLESRNAWTWNDRQIQTGEGWLTNGAALIARSWSCSPSASAGSNNENCRTTRRDVGAIGVAQGGLGLWPMDSNYSARWLQNQASNISGIPLIEYCGSSGTSRFDGVRRYEDLSDRPRDRVNGFVDETGMLWVDTQYSQNFRYITDENPDIRHMVAAKGRGGIRTAMNAVTGRFVPRAQTRPRWQNLSYNESHRFTTDQAAEKIDPWRIEGSPWHALDMMKRWGPSEVNGRQYNVDYRTLDNGNTTFVAVAFTAPEDAISTGQSVVDLVPNYIDIRNQTNNRAGFSLLNVNWPIVSYGLIDPWSALDEQANGMPYDFAMPIFMAFFKDMYFEEVPFAGRTSTAPTAPTTITRIPLGMMRG